MLGLVRTGFALNLYIDGLSSTPAQDAVIIQYLEPASAIFYAAIFLSELLGITSILSGILIIAANLVLAANSKQGEETNHLVKNDWIGLDI
jgi:drug/metabolite transporter (DMT)-like permease